MARKRVSKQAKMVGSILRAARRRKGLTQGEVALRVHRATPSISAYERGKELPRVDTLVALAEVLDLELLAAKPRALKVESVVVTGYALKVVKPD